MNAAAFSYVKPNRSFPWFEDYEKHNFNCKVYNDGGCYIAIPQKSLLTRKKPGRSVDVFLDELFDQLHFEAIKKNVPKKDLQDFILAGLKEKYPQRWGLASYVVRKLNRVYRNLAARKKRFRRKAYLHPWNYFVTFTYDNDLQSEETFKKGLRKSLSNLHTRRGWLYMGVFERAPETGRLHFHAIMNVPAGQMIGEIEEHRDYSTRRHKIQVTHSNTFFKKRFGRNDFAPLSDGELRHGNTLKYLLKYLEKSDERIIYSRGIPSEFMAVINDNDVICEVFDFVTKFILFDDVIDYEADVKRKKSASKVFHFVPISS